MEIILPKYQQFPTRLNLYYTRMELENQTLKDPVFPDILGN